MTKIALSETSEIDLGPLSTDLLFMVRTLQSMLRPDGQVIRHALDTESGMIGLLSIIWIQPGISQNELASVVALKKSAVTKLVTQMEDRGLITRTKSPEDRRINNLTLTASGEALIAKGRQLAEDLNARLFKDIAPADQATFFAVMGQLFARLSTEGAQISLNADRGDRAG